MFAAEINNDEINKLPLGAFNGGIFVIDTFEKLDDYLPLLSNKKQLGFDTETKPSFKKGRINAVSLLQLSTKHEVFLFRLNKIGFPKELIIILSDPTIEKIGLGIKDDLRVLKDLNDFEPAGFIDLQDIVEDYNIESKSLRKLAAITLNFRISKGQQLSNWEQEELTEAQKTYAATDAWACLEIYHQLNNNPVT